MTNEIKTTDTLPHTPGSDSSLITSRLMVDPSKNQRQRAWEYILSQGGRGATYRDLKDLFGMDGPRMTELRRLGRVRQTGDLRKTPTGCVADVYVAVPRVDWPEPRHGWPCPVREESDGKGSKALRAENTRLWDALELFGDNHRKLAPCPWCYWYGIHAGGGYRNWLEERGKGRCVVEDINQRATGGVV